MNIENSTVSGQGAPLVINNKKQLFIDERFFASSSGIELRMNRPYQSPDPVLVADKPWEAQGIGGYNTVMQEDGRFRMWYAAIMIAGLPAEGAIRLCYAESDDGITWHKPELGLVSFKGSKANNIVAPLDERQSMQGATVFCDPSAPEHSRYRLWTKFLPCDDERKTGISSGLWAMHSPDGLSWSYDEDQPCPRETACDTQNVVFWDRRIARYVGYTRSIRTQWVGEAATAAGLRHRAIDRMTSDDFRSWSDSQLVFKADHLDLNRPVPSGVSLPHHQVDIYTPGVFQHPEVDDAYFMLPSIYHHWGEDQAPAVLDTQLLTSRDGIDWRRQGNRETWLRRGLKGTATAGMLFANPWPVFTDNETWVYYAGNSGAHTEESMQKATSAIFRAVLRRDGFVSADAGPEGGEFVTPQLATKAGSLKLNVDSAGGGWVQVEVLGPDGHPLEGYSLEDCDPICTNEIDAEVLWKGQPLGGVDSPVRFHLVMRNTKLYSLFCSDSVK